MAKSNKQKKLFKNKQKSKEKTLTTSKRPLVTPCHYGNVAVTKTPFPLFGAGWSRGFHKVKDCIVIDLADVIIEPKVTFWNMVIPDMLNDRYSPDCGVIRIQWVDGGVPSLSPVFWHELAAWLEIQNKTVVVACMGGHGRTGTALAILAGIYRLHGASDLGEWVRSRHCSHAIETQAQVDYIEDVTGETLAIKPSWSHEIDRWKKWQGKSTTYVGDNMTTTKENQRGDCMWTDSCASQDCGNCRHYGLVADDDLLDSTLIKSDQKVFGWFDKNDVYHTGYPPDGESVACVVSQNERGEDVFEYIYDADKDDFLPTY